MQTRQKNKFRSRSKKISIFTFILALILAGFIAYFLLHKDKKEPTPQSSNNTSTPVFSLDEPKTTKFKIFTAQEFSNLYNQFAYPNTQKIINDFSITGDPAADMIIFNLAEAKGYKIRSAPVTENFVQIKPDISLQRKAAEAWKSLQQDAKKDGIDLDISQGYRSAEDQDAIFIGRLGSINSNKIINHKADNEILNILKMTAPPGYSRHHTGYTVDLSCPSDPGKKFENSECFSWLNEDNYLNAKKNGWIPSYPDGIKNQGPDPEPWEYVWVGTDSLRE